MRVEIEFRRAGRVARDAVESYEQCLLGSGAQQALFERRLRSPMAMDPETVLLERVILARCALELSTP